MCGQMLRNGGIDRGVTNVDARRCRSSTLALLPFLVGGLSLQTGCTPLGGAGQVGGNETLSPAGLPLRTIAIGAHVFQVELAATPQAHQRGLMLRTALDTDAGMLFVFAEDQPLGFWMVNTLIPLDIAFMDSAGTILNIDTMQPETTDFHYSDGPARYALEVNAGEFARRGIQAGDVVVEVGE